MFFSIFEIKPVKISRNEEFHFGDSLPVCTHFLHQDPDSEKIRSRPRQRKNLDLDPDSEKIGSRSRLRKLNLDLDIEKFRYRSRL